MPHKGEKNFQMQFSCTYRLNVEETKFSFIFLLKYLQLVFLSHLHTWCWWISVQMPSSHALEVRHQPLVCAAEHTQSQFSTLADSAFDLLFTSVQLGLYLKPTNFVRDCPFCQIQSRFQLCYMKKLIQHTTEFLFSFCFHGHLLFCVHGTWNFCVSRL